MKASVFIPSRQESTSRTKATQMEGTASNQALPDKASGPEGLLPKIGLPHQTKKALNEAPDYCRDGMFSLKHKMYPVSSTVGSGTYRNAVPIGPTICKQSCQRDSGSERGHNRKNSIDSLMKGYSNWSKFSGTFTEEFNGAMEQLATLCDCRKMIWQRGFL